VLRRSGAPLSVSGFGTMMALHARPVAPSNGQEAADRDPAVQELLHLALLARGFYVAPRGSLNLSLPVTDDQLAAFLTALAEVSAEIAALA
jgi:glutamate-1-semialdehyde 2,1-aminomutase